MVAPDPRLADVAEDLGRPDIARARYALSVLSTVYLFSLLDRGLMNLLAQPIEEDLGLSDTQLGFLTGTAFAILYAMLGLPLARWVDRGNRVAITSLAIAIWSLTVMASSLVANFAQLLVTRAVAAAGECKPPTCSLLGDYFPQPAERTRAMSIYWLGGPVAVLVSSIAGGWVNEHYGWRTAFFLMGAPGLLLAILVKLTLAEPRERALTQHVQAPVLPPIRTVAQALWHQRSCRYLTFGLILYFMMAFGLSSWSAAFMMRSHCVGTTELGVWIGLISGLGASAGILSGGYVVSHWFANNDRGQMRVCAAALVFTVPCYVAFLLLPDKHLALSMQIPLMLVMNFCIAPIFALMQRLVPDETRATTMATIMSLYNLIGMGLSPQLIGLLSDLLNPLMGRDSLRCAMLAMSTLGFLAAYCFWQLGQTVDDDLAVVASRQHWKRDWETARSSTR